MYDVRTNDNQRSKCFKQILAALLEKIDYTEIRISQLKFKVNVYFATFILLTLAFSEREI